MIVVASYKSNYLFCPQGYEIPQLEKIIKTSAQPSGVSPSAYDEIDCLSVSGYPQSLYLPEKTRHFKNEQSKLSYCRSVVELATNKVIDCSNGLSLPDGCNYSFNTHGCTANHIPQLFTLIDNDKIVINISGGFSFSSGLFGGFVQLMPLTDFINGELERGL